MPRSGLALAAVFGLLAAIFIQNSRIHGVVHDGAGRPLAGAYVWVADADRVQLRIRTDAQGRFQAWHRPFALRDGAMLICAPGHSTLVSSEIVRAWIAEFGLGAWPVNAPHLPQPDSTWRHAAPSECASRVARAASKRRSLPKHTSRRATMFLAERQFAHPS
jgi:hypothetical protein